MTPDELICAAEAKLRDADINIASCAGSLNKHRTQGRGVPNVEVIALAQLQATVGQAYAVLAMAKASVGDAE